MGTRDMSTDTQNLMKRASTLLDATRTENTFRLVSVEVPAKRHVPVDIRPGEVATVYVLAGQLVDRGNIALSAGEWIRLPTRNLDTRAPRALEDARCILLYAPPSSGKSETRAAEGKLDVLGVGIEFLDAFHRLVLLRGTLPPHAVVPLHSHPEPETFVVVEGTVAIYEDGEVGWRTLNAGDVAHVRPSVRHALSNASEAVAKLLIVTEPRIADFFCEVGVPTATGDVGAPAAGDIGNFVATAGAFGYELASPEENGSIGLDLG